MNNMNIKRSNWHEDVFFGLHYDLHANVKDTVLGKELTPENLRKGLLAVKPDWIQCDCKGHAGYTSWPTKVGTSSPGIIKDALRIHRDVTRELGIKLGMHYSGVWDTRAIEVHPEWARIDEAGVPDKDMTCRLAGYTENLMIPQILELIDTYDIDGFWVDGENWAAKVCWCDRCKAEFSLRTGIPVKEVPVKSDQPHWFEWLAFHRDLFEEHVTKYAEAVHRRKPECLVCSNWMYTVRQPDPIKVPVDYLSGDYDWIWGSHRAAVEGRMLDSRNITWDLMAWGFTKAGSMTDPIPWTVKPVVHLCQEVAEVVALGGAVMIYNNPQRTGWLTGWHQETFRQVADFCRARKEVCFKSKTVPQAAILHPAGHYYQHNDPLFNYGQSVQPIEGALHVLLETHRSTDILTEHDALERMDEYKLLVLPETTRLCPNLIYRLERFARSGGQVLLSGDHLAREYSSLVGAEAVGETVETMYLPVEGKAVGTAGPWQGVKPLNDTQVLTGGLRQADPDKQPREADLPVVTRRPIGKGAIVAVYGPIFRNYFHGHYPLLRAYFAQLVESMNIPWAVTVKASPRLEMVLRQKDGKTLVNLINRGAGEMLYHLRIIVDELVPVTDVTVTVRRPEKPRSVTFVPNNVNLDWSYADGLLTIRVPKVEIHDIIVIE